MDAKGARANFRLAKGPEENLVQSFQGEGVVVGVQRGRAGVAAPPTNPPPCGAQVLKLGGGGGATTALSARPRPSRPLRPAHTDAEANVGSRRGAGDARVMKHVETCFCQETAQDARVCVRMGVK